MQRLSALGLCKPADAIYAYAQQADSSQETAIFLHRNLHIEFEKAEFINKISVLLLDRKYLKSLGG